VGESREKEGGKEEGGRRRRRERRRRKEGDKRTNGVGQSVREKRGRKRRKKDVLSFVRPCVRWCSPLSSHTLLGPLGLLSVVPLSGWLRRWGTAGGLEKKLFFTLSCGQRHRSHLHRWQLGGSSSSPSPSSSSSSCRHRIVASNLTSSPQCSYLLYCLLTGTIPLHPKVDAPRRTSELNYKKIK